MTKYFRFFEIAYLIIAIVFSVETVLRWNTDRPKAYVFLIFAVLAFGLGLIDNWKHYS